MLAIPMPRYRPISARPAIARSSPARAACTAASGVSAPHRAATRSARVNDSRQPLLPQPQGGPSGSIVWWPTSPAVPSWPWRTCPSMTMTPPTPVPRVRPTIEFAPRPAPRRSSASPNARASLINATGMPRDASTGRATGRSSQSPGMLTRKRVVPAAGSYRPGTPTPSEAISGQRASAAAPVPASRPMTASGPSPATVGVCPRSRIRHSSPVDSTTAHLRLVTPRSIPRCRVAWFAVIGPGRCSGAILTTRPSPAYRRPRQRR